MGDTYEIDGQKLDHHIDRVFEWKYRGDTTPVYVEISPTARCNHACTFCALDFTNHTNTSIPRDRLITIGNELAGLDVRGVMFGGEGEPTLVPHLPETILHYAKLGIHTALTTNGTGLSPEFGIEGGRELSWVKVSINAGDAEAYAAIHRCAPSQFERVWDNIRGFVAGSGMMCPTIGVQAVALHENLASLPDLVSRAAEAELDYIVIKPFSYNKYSNNCRSIKELSAVEWSELEKECVERARGKVGLVMRNRAFDSIHGLPEYGKCLSVPFFWAYIRSNMDLVACSNHMEDARFVLGNLEKTSFKSIWYSHATMKREELKQTMRGFDISQCRKACRMNQVNAWLWKISSSGAHWAFI